jgi:hypothetical protein
MPELTVGELWQKLLECQENSRSKDEQIRSLLLAQTMYLETIVRLEEDLENELRSSGTDVSGR